MPFAARHLPLFAAGLLIAGTGFAFSQSGLFFTPGESSQPSGVVRHRPPVLKYFSATVAGFE